MVVTAVSALFIRDFRMPNLAGYTPIHLLVPVTLSLYVTHANGWVYLASAIVLDALFLRKAFKLYRSTSEQDAKKLFIFSNFYMMLLFIALFVDASLRLVIPALR